MTQKGMLRIIFVRRWNRKTWMHVDRLAKYNP
jgi:hypothetical protein